MTQNNWKKKKEQVLYQTANISLNKLRINSAGEENKAKKMYVCIISYT